MYSAEEVVVRSGRSGYSPLRDYIPRHYTYLEFLEAFRITKKSGRKFQDGLLPYVWVTYDQISSMGKIPAGIVAVGIGTGHIVKMSARIYGMVDTFYGLVTNLRVGTPYVIGVNVVPAPNLLGLIMNMVDCVAIVATDFYDPVAYPEECVLVGGFEEDRNQYESRTWVV